ncbi:hypothetical protein FSP39_018177 [Pinctada imbricata]|uniref:FAD/NAD(P)-binding domain-containing protein n=1 Tax=Pinctada imbricata TaxID=66713 RepID=A0AA88XJF9_PINIB|nr:hypothetical protein FSP39_018177 [Pinctada imbricata]
MRVILHTKQIIFQQSFSTLWKRTLTTDSEAKRERLIILGSGWGSYRVLRDIDKKKYDVVVVTPRNHFLFTPLLASTTVGTLEFRSIIEPVRNTIFRQTDHFHLSYATALDMEKKILTCESALRPGLMYDLNYDKLVIGIGALSNTFNVPGVYEHAFFLKEVADARKIRNRILTNIELSTQPKIDAEEGKRLLHFVIVGGGPTGVEFGAELYDFVKEDVARLYKQKHLDVNVTLIESNQILSSFDERLRKYAEKKIKQRDRFKLIQSAVTEVTEKGVRLKDGEFLPCGMVVWSTGVAPRPFIRKLDVPKNKQGQILTDNHLHVIGDTTGSVFALGDCADIEKLPLPCTAQVAEREGKYLAKKLNGKTDNEFKYINMGMMTYIGRYQALTEVTKVKMQGVPSWLLWRSAYLTRLGSWRLRMQVPLDWTKTLLYGRDTSRVE